MGEGEGAPGGPRYDMKYSGEKVLNLGFGTDPNAAAAANPLSWENMRKARPSAAAGRLHASNQSLSCEALQAHIVYVIFPFAA